MSSAGDIGERRIIEMIIENLEKMPNMPLPFGDDVSAVQIGRGRLLVVKVDMLVGGTDVPPGMTVWQAARKAVVMNVSDLATKGVKPMAVMASVGIPRNLFRIDIEDIGRGLNAGAREYGIYVIGGDTNEASDIIIDCAVFGISSKRNLITRSGARPGDILAVTGMFGKTSSGLKILLEDLEAPSEIRGKLLNSVYLPVARLKEGLAIAESKVATASIDSSDGLAICLHELHRMSGVGFTVTSLPIAHDAERFAKLHGLNAEELTLYGGEEYELVVTIKPRLWGRAQEAVKGVGGNLIPIGNATKEGTIILKTEGREKHIPPRGWEHFRR